ncbi:MAG: nicotinate-nucleotide adenylyltransferase [Gammaproteobacteria bacterium]|nr:nicotinate-nucleotide adenylyltransferase [Gammaproteobacteria bacterium]
MSHSLYGLYGGTFDPVHNGHLGTVLSIVRICRLEEVCWIPAGIPAHRRSPFASAQDRYEMVNLALRNYPELYVSNIEIDQKQACFTYHTVTKLRQIYPDRVLCFILGLDALLEFESWHRWPDLLSTIHLIIMNRPGVAIPNPLPNWWERATASSMDDLRYSAAGRIYFPPIQPCAISSSQIRTYLSEKSDISQLVPKEVQEYIQTNNLYHYDPKSEPVKP